MSTTVHIFAGPSLPPAARTELPGFEFHGPAAQGDVYALVAQRPFAIGLIDGYFERVPAVWHKEILWALSEGVHVFGAASMGALRAAELAAFGMVGVGRVYDALAAGQLTDDDEVTIVHAAAEQGYRPLSEAMVNIRATLAAAAQQGILSAAQVAALIADAKQRFYPDRSFPAVLEAAQRELPYEDWQRFAGWLGEPANRVDQKRQDALDLVRALSDFRAAGAERKSVTWSFRHTDAWDQVRRAFLERRGSHARAEASFAAPAAAVEAARLRALEIELARQYGFKPGPADLEQAVLEYCRSKGLPTTEALAAALESDGLPWAEFERLMRDQACVRWSRLVLPVDVRGLLADIKQLAPTARRTNTDGLPGVRAG